jgi:hypothetical protein
MEGVSFNRDWVWFSFVAGQGSYVLGKDFLSKYPDILNLQQLFLTDQIDSPVTLLPLDQYNNNARGGTSTGRPVIGTVHSSNATLEVYPKPNAAYTAGAYIKRKITKFSDIPEQFHDVLYSAAITLLNASANPFLAAQLTEAGLQDILRNSQTAWSGSQIPVDRTVSGANVRRRRADSGNLYGS